MDPARLLAPFEPLRPLVGVVKRSAILFFAIFAGATLVPFGPLNATELLAGAMTNSLAVRLLMWMRAWLLPPQDTLIVLGPFDAFNVIMLVGLYLAVAVTLPYAVAQVLSFAADALHPREKRLARPLLLGGGGLFLLGALFGLLVVLPPIYRFSYELQVGMGLAPTISLTSFVDTTFGFVLGLGFAFEIPVLCAALGYLGILSSRAMLHYTRFAIMGSFVVAFVISPGVGCGIIEGFIGSVLTGLYVCSIWVVRRIEVRRNVVVA